jgi:flavin-dependent dehydrogenase
MKRADVIVIGAGPSGLRAAGRLAAAGLDVRVLEKKSRVGANVVCTGIVGKEVFDDFGLQKKLGLATPRDFLKEAQVEASFPGRDTTTLFFGRDVAPGAFAWSVPAGEGRVRVGLLTKRDPKACLRKLLDARFNGRPGTGGEAPIRTKPVAQGLLSGTFGDRVLAVGEAAAYSRRASSWFTRPATPSAGSSGPSPDCPGGSSSPSRFSRPGSVGSRASCP